LVCSSLWLPYEQGIIGTQMHPLALGNFKEKNINKFFQQEETGTRSYYCMYAPLLDKEARPLAYFSIPYFANKNRIKEDVSGFFLTLFNLNAFILLMAGGLAILIANRVNAYFALVVERMRKVDLEKRNEPLLWNREDEIGVLVREYNKMLLKLEESAAALVRSEREGAWKEMAKQVAHEIKNPLTPMKLSLQYLKRAMDNNQADFKKLVTEVSHTLIEQIEYLNHIANEFSQFANVENVHIEFIHMHELLRNVLTLFQSAGQVTIITRLAEEDYRIKADKSHMNRVLTNLLQNAIQSIPPDRSAVIRVEEELTAERVRILVSDNGTGIPEEVQPFIFTPNFTTKTSGSGLGLAMCKRMVEQANGHISFRTKPDEGTSFIIELPRTH